METRHFAKLKKYDMTKSKTILFLNEQFSIPSLEKLQKPVRL